jgi:small subunit ribosomal protein S6
LTLGLKEERRLRDYELVVVISPEIAEEDVPSAIEKVSQFIIGRGGTVAGVNRWGRRKLAYPIQRHMEGNYVVTQFRLDPNEITGLEASLGLAEEVIRHLVVRTDED